jgi:hypothetical protein
VGIFRRGSKDTSAELSASTTATSGEDSGGEDIRSPSHTVRAGGPFDRSEVPSLDGRLDLGALWLTGAPGMELRLEVEEESQNVVGVTAVLGESAVQLQAFAAPRSEGIWDEIRTEIAASITSQGGTADKVSGPLGTELRAQMPGQGPDGRTVFSPVRFVGVDGPRWFLRAVLSGQAAVDEGAASTLLDLVRGTVVVRGDEAMAPRELLSLTLPVQSGGEDSNDQGLAGGDSPDEKHEGAPSIDDFKPFERGPEITEIH